MRRLWKDVKGHRHASGLFVLYWATVYALHAIPRWNRPNNAADIVGPVLQLHILLPVIAGALVAWWRRRSIGKTAGGMLAGAIVLDADFLFLQVPELVDNWLRKWPGGHQGEGIFEFPVWLIGIGLFGSLLGLAGAAGVTAADRIANGRQNAPAASDPREPMARSLLLMAGGLVWAVALVIGSSVTPGVRADTFVHAAPQRAATVFTYCAGLNVAIGVVLLALARWRKGIAGRPIAVTAGLLALFLGAMMLQATTAFWGHGLSMRHAVIACFACAAGDLAAGALALIAALRRQQTPESNAAAA